MNNYIIISGICIYFITFFNFIAGIKLFFPWYSFYGDILVGSLWFIPVGICIYHARKENKYWFLKLWWIWITFPINFLWIILTGILILGWAIVGFAP